MELTELMELQTTTEGLWGVMTRTMMELGWEWPWMRLEVHQAAAEEAVEMRQMQHRQMPSGLVPALLESWGATRTLAGCPMSGSLHHAVAQCYEAVFGSGRSQLRNHPYYQPSFHDQPSSQSHHHHR